MKNLVKEAERVCEALEALESMQDFKIDLSADLRLALSQAPRSFPPSTCAECGRRIPAGLTQQCEYGGLCSHHVPLFLARYVDAFAAQPLEMDPEERAQIGADVPERIWKEFGL
jgi:hypothetical protein